jgi:hypothetical protein
MAPTRKAAPKAKKQSPKAKGKGSKAKAAVKAKAKAKPATKAKKAAVKKVVAKKVVAKKAMAQKPIVKKKAAPVAKSKAKAQTAKGAPKKSARSMAGAATRATRVVVATEPKRKDIFKNLGLPEGGRVDTDTLEAAIVGWIVKEGKRRGDYCRYPWAPLMADAREMAQGRADLELFSSKNTPIDSRHFDWIDLLINELQLLGDDATFSQGQRDMVDQSVVDAVHAVFDARAALSRRANACGIALGMFKLTNYHVDNPRAVLASADKVSRMARMALDRFNHRGRAELLIANLDNACERLSQLTESTELLSTNLSDIASRRAACKKMLYDAMIYIAPWGQDVTAGDPTKRGRYELDNLFPSHPARPQGATQPTLTPSTPTAPPQGGDGARSPS